MPTLSDIADVAAHYGKGAFLSAADLVDLLSRVGSSAAMPGMPGESTSLGPMLRERWGDDAPTTAEQVGGFVGLPGMGAIGTAKGALGLAAMLKRMPSGPTLNEILQMTRKKGGATIDLDTMKPVERGFSVADTNVQRTLPSDASLRDFKLMVRDLPDETRTLGTWFNPEDQLIYVDPVSVFDKRFRAMKQGDLNDQLAIFNLMKKETLPVPK